MRRRRLPAQGRANSSTDVEDEGAPDEGESDGNPTDGTTVVPTTLIRGSSTSAPSSGSTTGFECGGGVTTGRTEVVRGATFTTDDDGEYSIGG